MIDIGLTTLEEIIINTSISCAIGGFFIIVVMYFYVKKLHERIFFLENKVADLKFNLEVDFNKKWSKKVKK